MMTPEEKKERIPNDVLAPAIKALFEYLPKDDRHLTLIDQGEVDSSLDYEWGREFQLNNRIQVHRGKETFIEIGMLVRVCAVERTYEPPEEL